MEKIKKVCRWYPLCPMKRFFEEGGLDEKWVKKYCMGDYVDCVRYHMEKEGISHPDNMLPDGSIDESLT
ncbi:MAG: uracil-DNA glycosylase [Candidatus Altiarchaeales archaeon ex4484_96]|nr:MAG: uracil-DNA glycosylase [Candidatus Altiarchaeales archaeon ex4484_96]